MEKLRRLDYSMIVFIVAGIAWTTFIVYIGGDVLPEATTKGLIIAALGTYALLAAAIVLTIGVVYFLFFAIKKLVLAMGRTVAGWFGKEAS